MTTSITLTFQSPVNMKDFTDTFPADARGPGVYIWGFMIDGNFIPYYVGKAQGSITNRIRQHHKDIFKDDSTYLRLNKEYIEGDRPYYCDPDFPLVTSARDRNKLPVWMRKNPEYFLSRINYIGNKAFIELKYGSVTTTAVRGRDYPINTIPQLIDDYLTSNNIFVTFCSYALSAKQQTDFYAVMEAFVKYSLKGKTGSASLTLSKMQSKCANCSLTIQDLTGFNIFKAGVSASFPGYR